MRMSRELPPVNTTCPRHAASRVSVTGCASSMASTATVTSSGSARAPSGARLRGLGGVVCGAASFAWGACIVSGECA
jgi:hypothetical protein